MTLFNIESAIDAADNTISYEISEAIEYIAQDAYGVASIDDLTDEQAEELQARIGELDHSTSYLLPVLQSFLDVRNQSEQ